MTRGVLLAVARVAATLIAVAPAGCGAPELPSPSFDAAGTSSVERRDGDLGDADEFVEDARPAQDAATAADDLGLAGPDAQPQEDGGVDAGALDAGEPSFDCERCRAQASDRACVANNTACGCQHDRHCAGAERCDLLIERCVPCSGPSCWRSALYPADWTPLHTAPDGRFLHDFSYAGYHAGQEQIPDVSGPLFEIGSFGIGPDWRPAIQAAIDAAASAGGGVVYFPPGSYRVDGRISVQSSGVVLRGAGRGSSHVYFSNLAGMSDHAHIEIGATPSLGPPTLLSADAASRSDTVQVLDAGALAPGDRVALGWLISDAFRAEHGMSPYWGFAAGAWRAFFRRTVVSIDRTAPGAHRIVLDVPIRYAALVRDQASLRPIEGSIHEVGIEDLSLSNAVDQTAAQAEDRVSLVSFIGVEDGWLRRVESYVSPLSGPASGVFQLASHGISVINSRRLTLEDFALGRAQDRGSGGNGYLLELSRSNEILVQRALLRDGRHNVSFNWDFGDSGIVLRGFDSQGSSCDGAFVACRSEFHHALAMANLIEDSRIADGWVGGNRRSESSGAGHTATESVYWRLYGGDRIYSWQFGHGYLIGNDVAEQYTALADTSAPSWELTWFPFWALSSNGHTSLDTEPEDRVEGAGQRATLAPSSLYLDQLERRLAQPN